MQDRLRSSSAHDISLIEHAEAQVALFPLMAKLLAKPADLNKNFLANRIGGADEGVDQPS